MCTFGQTALIRFSIIVSDYHTVIDYQYSAAVSVPVCPLLSICFKLSTAGRRAEHFQRESVFFRIPSPWLGGVRLKRNCCALSIRRNYRCVRGCAPSLRQPSVMMSLPAGCELRSSALYGHGGGFLTAPVGKETRTCLGSGTIFFFIPSSLLSRSCTDHF